MKTQKLTIEVARAAAEERGGKCLSDRYENTNTSLQWQCERGHVWEAPLKHIRNHQAWCPVCGIEKNAESRRTDIGELRALAQSKGGKLLSTSYVNKDQKLQWRCAQGHEFSAAWYRHSYLHDSGPSLDTDVSQS